MCGIASIFNDESAVKNVISSLKIIQNRGKDGYGICTDNFFYFNKDIKTLDSITTTSRCCLGHALHSLVNLVPQPIIHCGKMVSTCEIYNWRELSEKYSLLCENDSDLLITLIEKKEISKIKDTLSELDGVYAACYWYKNHVYLFRDIIGIKPLWYAHSHSFAVSSEKKVLTALGYTDICELNPRTILKYDISTNTIEEINREFFSLKELNISFEDAKERLKSLLFASVAKRIPDQKCGILFSGGLDSVVLATICKDLKKDFICYTSALSNVQEPTDVTYAQRIAQDLGFNLKIKTISAEKIESYLTKLVPLIEDTNVVKNAVGLVMYVACECAKEDGLKVIFSGLGADDIFGGYHRQKLSDDLNTECLSNVLKIYERDTYRDDVITMNHNIELRLPYLDTHLVQFALNLPKEYKITEKHDKYILRNIASDLGIKDEYAYRKKVAAQYGSKFNHAIKKLAKKSNKRMSEYISSFSICSNQKLGVLFSSGKDSAYALYRMLQQNYSIECLISIVSENPDSYMFHTPNVHLVDLQAEAMELPLVKVRTKGTKEDELIDLKKAIKIAKETHGIDGIVTGAICSTYQRNRIEKICSELNLKIFSPLWYMDQLSLMKALLKNKFEIIISSIAAEGLNSTWLGRIIDKNAIDELVEIHEKDGINIAFEGGEAETFVLNAPMFKKRIVVDEAKNVVENECTGRHIILNAHLSDKL